MLPWDILGFYVFHWYDFPYQSKLLCYQTICRYQKLLIIWFILWKILVVPKVYYSCLLLNVNVIVGYFYINEILENQTNSSFKVIYAPKEFRYFTVLVKCMLHVILWCMCMSITTFCKFHKYVNAELLQYEFLLIIYKNLN